MVSPQLPLSFAPAVLVAPLIYVVCLVIYRRYFHPLSKIPGPFLPAVTTLYQTYYNREYFLEVERLHRKYGPVVRILPNEVHLADTKNFDKIYYVGSKYTKARTFYGALMVPHSTFGAPTNEIHKIKRARLNPMFSRRQVLELEDVIQHTVDKVVALTQARVASGQPIDLHHMLRCVSVDVISEYAFDKSYRLLDTPDLGAHFFRMVRGIGPAMWFFQQFPPLRDVALAIPAGIMKRYMGPAMHQVASLQQEAVAQLEDVQDSMAARKLHTGRPTIFSELLDPEKQSGYPVPPLDELKDEVYSVLAAAADTTGNAMTVACYKVLSNPDICKTLRKELLEAFPDPNARLEYTKLEKLPYLTGVVKEGIRLSFGVPGRLPREVPQSGDTFNGYFVPAGTVVSMSSWIMHRNSEVFPDPMRFEPTRWLDPATSRKLEANIMAFGGGSRGCVGMPLAYAELYITIGTFFHRFGNLNVYETTDEDMKFDDFFSSYHLAGRKWLKAIAVKA